MATYALWNNKGGVGKSYLTFQIACQYAVAHPAQKILVIDLCPQANCSSMMLGGILKGNDTLDSLSQSSPRVTISGYFEDRITSPYVNPQTGTSFLMRPHSRNSEIPNNIYLLVGDDQLEIQMARVSGLTQSGPQNSWQLVHGWIGDLIEDVRTKWNVPEITTFIDCNPSFTLYTEMAMTAADRLIIPFSADGSSKRAVRSVLSLVYGVTRNPGAQKSLFYTNSDRFRMKLPKIYSYVGNRLTQANYTSAGAFRLIVNAIGEEIFNVWKSNPNEFEIHPTGTPAPLNRNAFRQMFQYEVPDANTASVVSGSLGIPIVSLSAGNYDLPGKRVVVNQSQLDKQIPNIRQLVAGIE
ncbi:MAG: AAA family ATPase [Chloroflexi bacterium]|nr:AAA family ATPase [Chloroflexota bacterium]